MGKNGFTTALAEVGACLKKNNEDRAASLLAGLDVLRLTKEQTGEMLRLVAQLPAGAAAGNVDLCYNMALTCLQLGDEEGSARWYKLLAAQRDHWPEDSPQRRQLENRVFCYKLAMPQGHNTNMLFSLAVLAHEFGDSKLPLARLSATGKFPSVLRGAKDCSALGRHYKASASMIRPLLPTVMGENAFGVCEVGIAEILYERGEINDAAVQAGTAASAEDAEISFAALAILARVATVDPTERTADEYLAYIGAMLEAKQAHWLQPNYQALLARHAILTGNLPKVKAWMEESGLNDLDRIAKRDLYELITRAKAYICLGQYRSAATLLENLAAAAAHYDRPLDHTECLLNSAIAFQQQGSGDHAMGKLEQALLLAQEFSYVRVFADCGQAAAQLLERYAKTKSEAVEERYLHKALEYSREYARLYPLLYKAAAQPAPGSGRRAPRFKSAVSLTNSELQVLQLLDSGRPNKDIARELSISASTVKFHLSNIMGKLQAANRVEVIKHARDIGLLS